MKITVGAIENQPAMRLLLLLNGLAIISYLFIGIGFDYIENIPVSMFSTVDAQTYRDVAAWLYGLQETSAYITLRPFFYPLIVGIVFLGDTYSLWYIQLAAWLATLNLLYLSAYRLTGLKTVAAFVFVFIMVNVSLIVLTFHALTETVSILLVALWIFIFVKNGRSSQNPGDVFVLTTILSLLVVIKPVFQLHLVLFLGWLMFRLLQQPNRVTLLMLTIVAMLPVFIQLVIMTTVSQSSTVSEIEQGTFRAYYFSKVYMVAEALPDLETARFQVGDYEFKEILNYLSHYPLTAIAVFIENIARNVLSRSHFVDETQHFYLFLYTVATNFFYTMLHIIFLPLLLYTIWNNKNTRLVKISMLYLFSLIIIITSGISFAQGDRLVIIALPFWVTVYSFLIVTYYQSQEYLPKSIHL